MRLDRFVSRSLGVSRREARQRVRSGGVRVDGERVQRPEHAVPERARVEYDDQYLHLPGSRYLMLHKPTGLLSATRDAGQATVMSLLPVTLAAGLHLVGRLDKETSGLLLLTDDGGWSHRIASPRHSCSKVYVATLAEPLVADAEQRLAAGLLLRGERRPTRPARLQRLPDNRVRVAVAEGRYHLVRRLFGALGNRVTALHRERVGGLALDPSLQPGAWRHLSDAERDSVLAPQDGAPV